VTDDFLEQVYDGKVTSRTPHAATHHHVYEQLLAQCEEGYGVRFAGGARDADELRRFARMRKNLSHFAAQKQQAAVEALDELRQLPRADFLREARKYTDVSHGAWLEAEARAAQVAGEAADRWATIERRAYLYPNLRYETAGDARVREAHRTLDQAIYPVSHAFWDEYYPPNGYRCRCKVVQTDDEPNMTSVDWRPDPGLRHNPGKTEIVFGDDHPYFATDAGTRADLAGAAEKMRFERDLPRNRRAAVRKHAGTKVQLPGMKEPARITEKGLEQVVQSLNQIGSPEQAAMASDLLPAFSLLGTLLRPESEARTYSLHLLDVVFVLAFDTEGVLASLTTRS
jgi:SPP1 gp7 family putative phage head morphogenesis protein